MICNFRYDFLIQRQTKNESFVRWGRTCNPQPDIVIKTVMHNSFWCCRSDVHVSKQTFALYFLKVKRFVCIFSLDLYGHDEIYIYIYKIVQSNLNYHCGKLS